MMARRANVNTVYNVQEGANKHGLCLFAGGCGGLRSTLLNTPAANYSALGWDPKYPAVHYTPVCSDALRLVPATLLARLLEPGPRDIVSIVHMQGRVTSGNELQHCERH